MRNIIFMDIDGTLVTQDGQVPRSAKKAIKGTRNNGNLVYLCTGRSLPEITEDILDIGFDGIIGAGGAYIETNGIKTHHQTLNERDVREVTNYFDHHEIGYYLESNDGIFANRYCIPNIKESSYKLIDRYPDDFDSKNPEPLWFYKIINRIKDKKVNFNNINKISFISIGHPFEKVKEKYEEKFEVHHGTVFQFGPNSGELGVKNQNKYTAVKKVVKNLEITISKSYAFGDGLNDLDMFEAVDYSVAMENAKEELKQKADTITKTAGEDGIYKSFKKIGLI